MRGTGKVKAPLDAFRSSHYDARAHSQHRVVEKCVKELCILLKTSNKAMIIFFEEFDPGSE